MSRFAPHRLTLLVVIIGLLFTAALTTLSRVNYLRNEQRLVRAQTELTGSALTAAPLDVANRLGSAVDVVAATDDVARFRTTIGSSLTTGGGRYAGVLLFQLGSGPAQLRLSVGAPTMLAPASDRARSVVDAAARAGTLQVIRLTSGPGQRLGYAMSSAGAKGTFVAYAEQALPANRRLELAAGSPLRGSDFAIYLGRGTDPADLLATNASHLPLGGTKATTTVPFGSSSLTLTLSPRGSLLGSFAQFVALAIAVGGVLFTAFVAFLTQRLQHRRTVAEELAAVSQQLYRAERNTAETLQHALLPDRLPACPQLDIAARYLPGTVGIDVGGDWYDVVMLDEHHAFFAVGDVSGRGLEAATTMGILRTAMKAYALEGDDPAVVLGKLGRMVDVRADGRFATVLCGRIDLRTGATTVANAGHPPPLLVEDGRGRFVSTQSGPPVGTDDAYDSIALQLADGATLLAYTDGLVERRGESIGLGLSRLERATRSEPAVEPALDAVLDQVLAALLPAGPSDDVALLGLRWRGADAPG